MKNNLLKDTSCSLPWLSLRCWEAPRVSWSMLWDRETRVTLLERPLMLLYTSFLLQPNGAFRFVLYKVPRVASEATRAALVHEARVLHVLRDVRGVPRLHGLIQTPEEAIVMSFCPGEPLHTFLRRETVCTYLQALRSVSLTLKAMHNLGVAHGSLHPHNILVAVRQGHGGLAKYVITSIVGLRSAIVDGSEWATWADLHSVVCLAQDIQEHLTEDMELAGRYKDLARLVALSPSRLNWSVVLTTLCKVLHGESLASCTTCDLEVCPYFTA